MKPLYSYTEPRKPSEASKVEVTVGAESGMFRGSDHFAIQGAVDYVARHGGGSVRIGPGRYVLRNAVFLPSSVGLIGAGNETILQKHASAETELAEDQDWYAWHTIVADASAYSVGDGITLYSCREDAGAAQQVSRHTILGIEGNVLHLESQARMNHWIAQKARAVSTHSLIEAQRASDDRIMDLQLEGNRAASTFIDGNYAGAIFLQDCERVEIRNVTIRDWNGDAISWQICHDVHIENCLIDGAAMLGLHPGSGSQRPVMRGNTIRDCTIGMFWCWGVKDGVAEENEISNCSKHGISTGHRDTDNLIRNNRISGCGEAGIFFRPERSGWHTSHRVVVEGNTVQVPNEPATAVGISLVRGVEDVIVRHNRVMVPRGGRDRGIVVDAQTVRAVLEGNEIREE
jgi:polygalacturonase